MPDTPIFSVSEITTTIKLLLEENIPTVWVEGEVSNFKAHYSGHYYFTLKDATAQISAVMWRSRTRQLTFDLEDGMKIQALGNVRLYEKSGRYQLDILRMQPAGIGRLQQEFERLKQALLEEGLFDESHKKELPVFPERIGVITSGTGAAIRDILNVLRRRAPHVQIIVHPAKVQGQGAAEEIAAAIDRFNRYGQVDVLIVGRGGGSLEDLWAFNEESVARAIYHSKIPIISAVGHEIDFTIADFVADLRAATPSAAAELVVPDFADIKEQILYLNEQLVLNLKRLLELRKQQISGLSKSYGLRKIEDKLHQYALQIDELNTNLERFYSYRSGQKLELIRQLNQRLNSLNPRQVLRRGYSITYHNGKVITHWGQVASGSELKTELAQGYLKSTLTHSGKESGNGKEKNDL
jgi:exodeoxyribonuclease VII large subunit